MAASVQCRQQERNLGMVMEDKKDDDLALFLDLQSRPNGLLPHETDDLDDQLGAASKQDRSSIFKTTIEVPPRRTGFEAFLNSENEKTDYDWLLTPPDTPLFPSLETEQNNTVRQVMISNGLPVATALRLVEPHAEPASKNDESSEPTLANGLNSSISSNGRPSSGGGTPTASRPATPTRRATLPSTTKPSRSSTPTLRPTLPAMSKPARASTPTSRSMVPASTKPRRASTPTPRASLSSTAKHSRPSTPTSRASVATTAKLSRPSTPTSRAMAPTTAKTCRPSTPTSCPYVTSSKPSVPVVRSSTPTRSSSVMKSAAKVVKNPVLSRGSSPTMKSRPWKPSEMPGFSHEAPSNLKTTLPDRPASASRSRPGPPNARSSSNGRTRQQSSSPSRLRAPNGSASNNSYSSLAMSRGHSINSDNVNPVLMGTKMVERVVNMRKLAPPKLDDHISNNSLGKSLSSQENFGGTLSKSSLDMAIRHMGIRKSITGNQRPVVTNIPASSVYSVRSGSAKSRTVSASDSPLAATSDASSEPSVNMGSNCSDGINVDDDGFGSERANFSPASG